MFLRTDWLNVSLLLFQIWYLASRIFRSLFPNTQGAVTRFNPYEFLLLLNGGQHFSCGFQSVHLAFVFSKLAVQKNKKKKTKSEIFVPDVVVQLVTETKHLFRLLLNKRRTVAIFFKTKQKGTLNKNDNRAIQAYKI